VGRAEGWVLEDGTVDFTVPSSGSAVASEPAAIVTSPARTDSFQSSQWQWELLRDQGGWVAVDGSRVQQQERKGQEDEADAIDG